jgi:hypothetical protein
MDVAIATMTLCPPDLSEWIEYHFRIGISRIYLRLEGERMMNTISILERYPDVIVLETQMYPEGDQMLRQTMFVETAIERALEDSMDFLLHIDDDELLYIHPGLGLSDLLSQMGNDYDYLHIDNVEAVYPHTSKDQSCYRRTVLFRECNRQPCRSYGNGKSMARLSKNTSPHGVHYFKGIRKDIPHTMALILHFESCDFTTWKQKFKILPPSSFSFYKDSHRLVQKNLSSDELHAMYRQLTGFSASDSLLRIDLFSEKN